jgi:hypothetical protein
MVLRTDDEQARSQRAHCHFLVCRLHTQDETESASRLSKRSAGQLVGWLEGSGVPILIGGYFFKLSSKSFTIFII